MEFGKRRSGSGKGDQRNPESLARTRDWPRLCASGLGRPGTAIDIMIRGNRYGAQVAASLSTAKMRLPAQPIPANMIPIYECQYSGDLNITSRTNGSGSPVTGDGGHHDHAQQNSRRCIRRIAGGGTHSQSRRAVRRGESVKTAAISMRRSAASPRSQSGARDQSGLVNTDPMAKVGSSKCDPHKRRNGKPCWRPPLMKRWFTESPAGRGSEATNHTSSPPH